MKKIRLFTCLFAALAMAASCVEKDPEGGQNSELPSGILVLNEGNMGSNDASLSLREINTKTTREGVFRSVNNIQLGDTGQDILRCQDRLYIAVSGSKVIFVVDSNLKMKCMLEIFGEDSNKLTPRSMIYAAGKVYVTCYEGFLAEIDCKSYEYRLVKVGPNPEGLAYLDGKIYVANSGGMNYLDGYNSDISVVDAATLKETGRIDVNCNPQNIISDGVSPLLYICSWGNYADIPAKLQIYDTASKELRDLGYADVHSIALAAEGKLLVACGGYDAQWQVEGTIYSHDFATDTPEGEFSLHKFTPYYSLSTDPERGYVFVGTSNYKTNGNMYMLDDSGKVLDSWDTAGLNPHKGLYL